MNTTCVISNFNYASFVGDAIDGALRQTVPFNQIVVIDDGSTDQSVELLKAEYGLRSPVEIVSKANQGQLSCFNEGFARATGEIVFFLDADDVYEPDYLEQVLAVYRHDKSCDFVFCGRRLFGQQDRVRLKFARNRDFGYSVLRTVFFRDWLGEATSCLSMRRRVLEKFLPLPFVDDWRVRADDCLIFGASLAGARKRFLAKPLVRYRVHDHNHFAGRNIDKYAIYRRQLAINTLFEHLGRKLCINFDRLPEYSHREFHTIDKPTFGELVKYVRIGRRAQVSLTRRWSCIAEMLWRFMSSVSRGDSSSASPALKLEERVDILRFPSTVRDLPTESSDGNRVSLHGRRAA